jgi:hypothetical protein
MDRLFPKRLLLSSIGLLFAVFGNDYTELKVEMQQLKAKKA